VSAPPSLAGRIRRRALLLFVLPIPGSLLTACSVTPLTNKITVGEEPFVIGVGEGPDGLTDLFAAPAKGGGFVRLTFNRPEERFPRLSPDGSMVAYFRTTGATVGAAWSLVILNLLTNAERTAPLPGESGVPVGLGWSRDGQRVVVSAQGYLVSAAPSAPIRFSRMALDAAPAADSATAELLGDPPRARVERCVDGGGACIRSASGELTALGTGSSGAIRWGTDSVGYFRGAEFEVRPLAGGRSRRPEWSGAPAQLRDLTYHAGSQVTTATGESGIR
jgi:hypothetical protein